MTIACLAWGSLIRKPAPVELAGARAPDGPRPIEFAREADGGELATVAEAQVFWAPLATRDLVEAREQLRRREQTTVDRRDAVGSTTGPRSRSASAGRRARRAPEIADAAWNI